MIAADSVAHRLAGFHTFVKAFENAWGNRRYPTSDEISELKQFLVNFYDKLVQARPEIGRVDLGMRQKFRQEFITGSPLFIYGVMKIAVDLWWTEGPDADLAFLDTLKGKDGDDFLSLKNDEWRRRGILLPTYDPHTGDIRAWRITNSLQTRRAMAEAMHDRFKEDAEDHADQAA